MQGNGSGIVPPSAGGGHPGTDGSGGITTLDDVRALLGMGVHAALGMAIYTGRLRLEGLGPRSVHSGRENAICAADEHR